MKFEYWVGTAIGHSREYYTVVPEDLTQVLAVSISGLLGNSGLRDLEIDSAEVVFAKNVPPFGPGSPVSVTFWPEDVPDVVFRVPVSVRTVENDQSAAQVSIKGSFRPDFRSGADLYSFFELASTKTTGTEPSSTGIEAYFPGMSLYPNSVPEELQNPDDRELMDFIDDRGVHHSDFEPGMYVYFDRMSYAAAFFKALCGYLGVSRRVAAACARRIRKSMTETAWKENYPADSYVKTVLEND